MYASANLRLEISYRGDFLRRRGGTSPCVGEIGFVGPRSCKIDMSDFFFVAENLRLGDRNVVHGTRMKFFRNKAFNVTTDCEEQLTFQAEKYCVVGEIQDTRVQGGEVYVLVRWKRLQDEEPGWEYLSVMKEDIPALVVEFLNEMRESGSKP